ncbi:baseplate assembly protein [Paraburkholderia sp. NMBU_R16]|uniref:baseplate J/gp47 family protein n=1 Tax=Paraburkholderia sp. NMBU_R16 TaxID=2698676 RepID=UPI00156441F6|nr:baseplate J/gp47 family protein [Paraburkholderia sp. NMBU_R16]NRO98124.1 baseplate assembly protein [Paraburkholderia sp. NMBU_R16]
MRATPIDLSQLPPPEIVEALDYETLLAERKARLVSLYPEGERAEIAATLELESEPLVRLLQENAYRELLLRQIINDKARATLLAYARGKTLEHIAALFDVERLVAPGDPAKGIDPVYEDDDSLRERVQLAPRGFSVAGPVDAYIFHARSADYRVLSATAYSPEPCVMIVTLLSREGDGTASAELIEIVKEALESKRPQADEVIVRSAAIVPYEVRATLRFFRGPDRRVALDEATKRTGSFTTRMHRIGTEVTLDGLYAAMRVIGVQKVLLNSPIEGVQVTRDEAPYCTRIDLIDGGLVDE